MNDTTFKERYARMFYAMSIAEAKEVLGFPSYYNPTPQEVTKAWRELAFKNHPDRGGDPKKMVEINVAKDLLEGKSRPSYTSNPWPSQPRQKPRPSGRVWTKFDSNYDKHVPSQYPFASAASKIPTNIDLKIISSEGFGRAGKEWSSPIFNVYFLYGQTNTHHVFAGIFVQNERRKAVDVDEYINEVDEGKGERGLQPGDKVVVRAYETYGREYHANVLTAPLSVNLGKNITKYFKAVCQPSMPDWELRKFPRKFHLWPGGRLTEQTFKQAIRLKGGMALKDALLGAGLVGDSDPTVKGRKSVVEMIAYRNEKKWPRGTTLYTFEMIQKGCDVEVRVNGKSVMLAQATLDKLGKKGFFNGIGMADQKYQWGQVINLTRLRGSRGYGFKINAETALEMLADNLTTEPSWLHIAIQRAAEEVSTAKTASLAERIVSRFKEST